MSMAHSVEVRPPFLDHRLVEFAGSLPESFKMRGSRQKFLLKELMKDKLPSSVTRRKKVGLDFPAHDWLRGPLRSLLFDTFAAAESEYSGFFNFDVIGDLPPESPEPSREPRISPLGLDDSVSLDEEMANSNGRRTRSNLGGLRRNSYLYLTVLLIAGAIYIGCIVSPPWLMDDVDAVQAQIARNMLASGDWVTARLDGVIYLEKAPLIYWLIAVFYKVFGIHDWAARLPVALSSVALAWLTAAFGLWAFGKRAAFYAGLCISTCIGLFLFTRVQIPDVMLTFTVALALWAFLRAIDAEESHPRLWAFLLAASMGMGLLLKSLIGVVFPVAAGLHLSIADAAGCSCAGPGGACARSAARSSCWPSRRPGMFSRPYAIRLISTSLCAAFPATITGSSGSFSSMNNCCVFWICGIRMTTTPSRGCISGCFTLSGCFPGAYICQPFSSCNTARWIVHPGRACWPSAGSE